MGQPQRNSP